jgi:hypothetical protein
LEEKKMLEVMPDLWITPVLAKNIGWVEDAIKVIHGDELGSHGFMNTMEG